MKASFLLLKFNEFVLRLIFLNFFSILFIEGNISSFDLFTVSFTDLKSLFVINLLFFEIFLLLISLLLFALFSLVLF